MDQASYDALATAYAFISIVVGVFGVISNILIIITYAKIGIKNSINTSYVAMAISDLGVIITTIIFFAVVIPGTGFYKLLSIVPGDFFYYTGNPSVAFSKLTMCITAYIALERSLCVALPHKVKLVFTRRLTIVVILALFIVCALPVVLVIVLVYRTKWKVVNNRTVLGTTRVYHPRSWIIIDFNQFMYGVVLHWTPLLVTLFCAIFLSVHLTAGSKWRQKGVKSSKDASNTKEDRLVKTVVLISVISIIFSSFMSANILMPLVAPEVISWFQGSIGTYDILIENATFMIMLNSCANIFIYYTLGSKFRETLRNLLHLSNSTA